MKALFIDTSAFLAVLFRESGHRELALLIEGAEKVFAAELLEAEARSAAARKGLSIGELDRELSKLSFYHPDHIPSLQLKAALSAGLRLRGADLWHLACALELAGDPSAVPFLTLDQTQAEAAVRLGFHVLPGKFAGGVGENPASCSKTGKTRGSARFSRPGQVEKKKKPALRRVRKGIPA